MVSKSLKFAALITLMFVHGAIAYTSHGASNQSNCKTKTYRYKDKDGVTVTNFSLPPEYSQDGYEIICASTGLVIRTVSPRKTDEQLAQEAAEAKRKEEEARLQREQERLDSILLNSYTDIADIERARDNELVSKDRDVMLLNNNIKRITNLLEHAQARAARDERLGKAISQQLLDEINLFKRRIAKEQGNVTELEEEKELIRGRYDSSMQRFNELKAAERIRLLRTSQDQAKENHAFAECKSLAACDNAWNAALRFASEYSTTDISYASDSTVMMRKPEKDNDISLVITRINNGSGDGASFVLEVRCTKTEKGENLCASEEVNSIKSSFPRYIQAGPTSRP